jgi:predicted HAD superfamily Cof-like phosphohydrolase
MQTNMQTNFQKVRDFNISFGIERSNTPSDKLFKLRWDLIQEESNELFDAIKQKNHIEIIDALSDILYVIHGAADSFEQDLDLFFNESTIQNFINLHNLSIDNLNNLKNLKGVARMEAVFEQTPDILNKIINNLYAYELFKLQEFFEQKNITEIIKQLVILLNYVYLIADLFGVDLNQSFNLVHESNMSKLAETEEIAKQTVEWYIKNETRYDSPAYRLSTIQINNQPRWVIFNKNSGKALKSIHYKAVELKELLIAF